MPECYESSNLFTSPPRIQRHKVAALYARELLIYCHIIGELRITSQVGRLSIYFVFQKPRGHHLVSNFLCPQESTLVHPPSQARGSSQGVSGCEKESIPVAHEQTCEIQTCDLDKQNMVRK